MALGEAKGREEGLPEALLMITEVRFPALLELAQQRVREPVQLADFRLVLKGVKNATSEEAARNILDLLAA
ncbi:MAG TPA: hypothetical protein VFA10_11350 [Ktedonobacteraceae bacterium]|nr:hypothetical protein [Ktedonobacteraceae bacterium]